MDLLNQNQYEKAKMSSGKKIVITLLILSVILAIVVISIMVYIRSKSGY